jgi:alpha-mannosidase
MRHTLRFTAEKIARRIDLIKNHIIRQEVALEPFRFRKLRDADDEPDLDADLSQDQTLDWFSHWAGADTHFLLTTEFSVPEGWKDPVALNLPLGTAGDIFSHPECIVYIDGKMAASADRHHWLVRLEPHLMDGKTHKLQLHGWTGWTSWPPNPNDRQMLFMKRCGA